jgi:hypothetical protein
MMTHCIRPAEHKDLPALAEFLARVYNADLSDLHFDPRLLEWKYLYPKSGWEGSRSYLLENNGTIAAHCGVDPFTFQLPDGKTVTSMTMTDWARDPSSPGAGSTLFRKLMEMAPTSFIKGGSPATRRIVPRIGFQQVQEALTYAAWIRPWREYRRRPRTGRSALRLLHGLTHPVWNRWRVSEGWAFVPVDQFDDSLLPIVNARFPWTTCRRTIADLNYLLQCPHLKMRGFLLRRAARLRGYFVIGRAEWEARLMECVVDSASASDWSFAFDMVTRAAQADPEVCRVRAMVAQPTLCRALARNGYWCQYKEPIVFHDPGDALGQAFPINFQLFDSDSGY